MTTGPHEPVGGGRYHEQRVPGGRGGGAGGAAGRRSDADPPATANEVAELRKAVAALTGAVDVLRVAVTDSAVRPTSPVPAPALAPAPAPDDPSRPKRGRRLTPSSDPELTRAERRVKIATAGVGFFVALSGALSVMLASAWAYIKGYADERVESAVQIEHAKAQVEAQERRIEDLLKNQASMQDASSDLRNELERVRSARTLFELRAKYLEEVRVAIAQKKKIPDKPPELVKAEREGER